MNANTFDMLVLHRVSITTYTLSNTKTLWVPTADAMHAMFFCHMLSYTAHFYSICCDNNKVVLFFFEICSFFQSEAINHYSLSMFSLG